MKKKCFFQKFFFLNLNFFFQFQNFHIQILYSNISDVSLPLKSSDWFPGDLYTELLADYEPLERPIANSSEAVLVRMGLVLQQIVDVDEKNQVVDVNAWLKFSWTDYSLKWDPVEYGGVTDLRFRKGQLWTPDVLMYNSADPQFDSRYASNLLVYPNGLVNWMPPGQLCFGF